MNANSASEPLALCWGSMDGVALREFVASAAQAGFSHITLSPAQYREARAAGLGDGDLAALLRDHGLLVSNIDPLFNWLPGSVRLDGDDAIAVCTQASAQEVFHIAQVVGTDLVNAPLGMASPASEQEIVDGFAALCEDAAHEGLRVSLEFMPFNAVPDLATASRVVSAAGCDNGGIMFDCWHHHRGGGTPQQLLEVPGERFFALQLDDALPQPMADMLEETLNHRCLPGQGCIDLAATLGNLRRTGADVVCDVEVFDDALRALAPAERARRLFDSSQALLSQLY